jgi:phytoene dehydrogenase-like protein
MLRISYFIGNYFPKGGSQAFSNDLGECFIQQGGHLMTQTRMVGMEIRGRRVRRLFLERGKRKINYAVTADAVLYCGDLKGLAPMLPEECPGRALFNEQLRQLRPSNSCFLIHIGARGLSREQLERLHGYHWRDWDPEEAARGSLKFKLPVSEILE